MAETVSKRKRDIIPEDEDEKLEIDVNLPEPPSKKAKRKEKKQGKSSKVTATATPVAAPAALNGDNTHPDRSDLIQTQESKTSSATATRSPHSIWIGNLPFSATKDHLRTFLQKYGAISPESITRLHLPVNERKQNKGFAYIDFDSEDVLNIALGLSEKLVNGRAVLIKNAKSFEGRPEKKADENTNSRGKAGGAGQKEPSKRVFVGNLSFDVTREELAEHFAQAGEVEDVFMATFEDSGKCKGFAWVRFTTIEAASNAVKGFIVEEEEQSTEDESEDGDRSSDAADSDVSDEETAKKSQNKKAPSKKRKPQQQRHYINRIQGRQLRCEYAEDAQTRYKKRYGKNSSGDSVSRSSEKNGDGNAVVEVTTSAASAKKPRPDRNLSKDDRQEMRRKRHDARTVAPGKALSNAPRAKTGAIVEGEGKKTTFD